MNLKRKEPKKPSFFTWILFNPKAFQVIFYMSIIMGMLIICALTLSAWVFHWPWELRIIFSVFAALNLYTSIKYLKYAKYTTFSINDMVYGSKYKPKEEVKENGNEGQNNRRIDTASRKNWPKVSRKIRNKIN